MVLGSFVLLLSPACLLCHDFRVINEVLRAPIPTIVIRQFIVFLVQVEAKVRFLQLTLKLGPLRVEHHLFVINLEVDALAVRVVW